MIAITSNDYRFQAGTSLAAWLSRDDVAADAVIE
jgi:hypothetical protein